MPLKAKSCGTGFAPCRLEIARWKLGFEPRSSRHMTRPKPTHLLSLAAPQFARSSRLYISEPLRNDREGQHEVFAACNEAVGGFVRVRCAGLGSRQGQCLCRLNRRLLRPPRLL